MPQAVQAKLFWGFYRLDQCQWRCKACLTRFLTATGKALINLEQKVDSAPLKTEGLRDEGNY